MSNVKLKMIYKQIRSVTPLLKTGFWFFFAEKGQMKLELVWEILTPWFLTHKKVKKMGVYLSHSHFDNNESEKKNYKITLSL